MKPCRMYACVCSSWIWLNLRICRQATLTLQNDDLLKTIVGTLVTWTTLARPGLESLGRQAPKRHTLPPATMEDMEANNRLFGIRISLSCQGPGCPVARTAPRRSQQGPRMPDPRGPAVGFGKLMFSFQEARIRPPTGWHTHNQCRYMGLARSRIPAISPSFVGQGW